MKGETDNCVDFQGVFQRQSLFVNVVSLDGNVEGKTEGHGSNRP